MRMFVCSVPREYEFVRDTYGYPKGYVQMLGLCRYDNLFPVKGKEKILLVMPTWRKWIAHTVSDSVEFFNSFNETEFARSWKKFLMSPRLQRILQRENMKLVFYLHRNMQKFSKYFMSLNDQAIIAVWPEYDCQQLLKEAECLITDYSSVAMDFAYMRKPVLYYQFDYKRFRMGHMGLGYYDYHRDGFGPICEDSESLLNALEKIVKQNYQMETEYSRRCDEFFYFHDRNYCKRNYEAIKNLS